MIKFYKDKRDKWRWRVTGENGEIIGSSSQGFVTRRVAKANINLLIEAFKHGVPDKPVSKR